MKIGGTAAPPSVCKGSGTAAKGSGLKAMIPKGVAVLIAVENPDGRSSAPLVFTR